MEQNLDGLPEEKRERVLNAAMVEFAEKGFERASTNEIVKRANISKGLLFHYFGSKKALFLFVYDYAIQVGIDEFFAAADLSEPDLFERLRVSERVKVEMMKKHPALFIFMQRAYLERAPQVSKEVEERNIRHVNESMARMYQNIDFSLFRRDVDVATILRCIMWIFEGLGNEIHQQAEKEGRPIDLDDVPAQADRMLDFMKKVFYQ